MQLFWQPPQSFFPEKGWQFIRLSDHKVIARWTPETRHSDLSRIHPDQAASTEQMISNLATITSAQEREMSIGMLTLGAMIDFRIAVAIGFGCRVDIGNGTDRYRLEITDQQGASVQTLWESGPIDGRVATAPVPSPVKLKAIPGERGVALFWKKPTDSPTLLITYWVQRKTKESDWEDVNKNPLLRSNDGGGDEGKAAYTDTQAPLETEIRYRVGGTDIFGRKSSAREITVFNPDFEALLPPDSLSAQAGVNKVKLSWKEQSNPYTAGYIIERTMGRSDLYRLITPEEGLTRATVVFKDTDVKAGLNYYYRIRSFDARGKLGTPSKSAAATVLAASAPPAPTKLAAEVNPIRVLLSWQVPERTEIGGYYIEKRTSDSAKWTRLNPDLRTIKRYEDMFPFGTLGNYQYRIVSVGMDMQLSKASKTITVQLPGHPTIPRPNLQTIRGNLGVVTLSFAATGKKELTDTILIVRGNDVKDLGLIIGKPISGTKTTFEDVMVRPGEDYWYALIAQDKDNNRSEMSDKLFVQVQSKSVPQADKPDCKYKQDPFRHVTITFKKPGNFLQVSVLKKTDSMDRWVTIADHVGGTDTIVDANPPLSGSVSYAILYTTENGITGIPSEKESIEISAAGKH